MDKSKHLTDEQPKKKDREAQVEFVAPYSLHDCMLRIRDTKSLDTGFMSPGIDPSFDKTSPGVYHFKIRRTWYDTRYRRHSAMVELRGYLKAIDETSTVVIAETHVSMLTLIVVVVLIGLMVASGVFAPKSPDGLFFVVVAPVILGLYGLWILWDRRTLIRVIHRALSDEGLY